MLRQGLRVVALLACATLSGCAVSATARQSTTDVASQVIPSPVGVALPTVAPNSVCGGTLVGKPIILRATSDGNVVGEVSGVQIPVLWPPGFRAVLAPSFAGVYDSSGRLFATPGEDISKYTDSGHWGEFNACATGSGVAVYPAP